jgi:hypothetical protein
MAARRGWWAVSVLAIAALAAIAAFVVRSDGSSGRDPRRLQSREERLRQTLFTLFQPVRLTNCTLERFGEPHDGGYLMCANLLDAIESAYSYGISGYDGWGCDVSRRFNVPVHQYDCFDTRQPSCPGGTLVFHAECVGGGATTDEEGRPFDTIANQVARNGDRTARLALKIDVEGAEWDSFLLAPDSAFEQIDQLVVEFHGVQEERFIAAARRLKQFFHVAHVHFNNYSCDPSLKPFPAWAYEVLFVNKRIGVTDESAAARGPHPFDAPNNPKVPDCQSSNQ